jgi:hypothetical protein
MSPRAVHSVSPDTKTFIRREDADRFIEDVRNDEPDLARRLRVEERELEAGGLN